MVLIGGTAYFEADDEPYEDGVIEETKTNTAELEIHVSAEYCEKCNTTVNIKEQ